MLRGQEHWASTLTTSSQEVVIIEMHAVLRIEVTLPKLFSELNTRTHSK